MGLADLHSACVIGEVTELSTSSASDNVQLVDNPAANGRARFIVECDQDVYLKMGDSNVTATSSDHLLPARPQSIVVTVSKAAHSYIAALRVTDDGTLKCTRIDDEDL